MSTLKLQKKIIKKISLLSAITLVLNMSMVGVFFNAPQASASEPDYAELIETPITTCQGSGELFLYKDTPFQPIATSFTTARDQLLIFTGNPPVGSLEVKVNGVSASLTNIFEETNPFHVIVYSVDTSSGGTITITAGSSETARNVQGYIAQDSANPVFDISSMNVVYNHGSSATLYNTMYLDAGTYSYVIFDKYSENISGSGPDTRNLNVNISGSDGVILNQDYDQPSPTPVEGAVVENYTITAQGSYTMAIETNDSVYWPVAQCEATCEGADYEFEVNANDDANEPMWVVGEDCWTPGGVLTNRIQDYADINVPAGNYNVKALAHRGGFYNGERQGQTNESYYLSINGQDGATSTDDAYEFAITTRLDDLGNFSFTGGDNTVYMNTAAQCPPDTNANSVDVSKLCLYSVEECGNGIMEGNEECDDGNDDNTDGCTNECVLTYCGDGTTQNPNGDDESEECDDGNDDNNDACANDCTLNTCGDGEINNQETCDDGQNNGVPCEPGYGETCSYCSNICEPVELTGPYCEDGVKNGDEECDGSDGVGENQRCTDECVLEDVLCEAELDVVFIMDRSGSMGYENPTRLSYAKTAANSFADKLRSGDQSALVSYANTASLDKTLSNNHAATKLAINSLSANGATNIGDAIDLATQESTSVRANPQAAKIQILLTDGKANKPNGSGYDPTPNGLEYLDVAYAITESTEAAAQGIIIFTIGLGNTADINETMLQTIAANTGGQYYYAPSGSDLDTIFNKIAYEVCAYGSISGCKYLDANNDGDIIGETTIPNWEITLQGTNGPISQFTDGQGCYAFSGLLAGNYTVAEVLTGNAIQTYPVNPNDYSITLSEGQNVYDINFGNYLLECGNNILDEGEECDDGNTENGDGCNAECQEEVCEHDVGVKYSYGNSFGTGIAVRPTGGEWIDDPVELLRNKNYDIKYLIDNHIEDSPNNIHVVLKNDDNILTEYDSPINIQHYKTVDFDTTGLELGTTTLSLLVEKINEIDCNLDDNYAEREIEIIAICGDGITDENLGEQCDDGNSINDDGCSNQCALPSGGPEYGSIKACKYMDADGKLDTDNDRSSVFGWEFILDDGIATTSQMTDGEIGCAVFNNLLAGDYEISETLGEGWIALWPANGTSTVAVAVNEQTQIDFINTKMGWISGYKFEDNDLASSTNALLPVENWIINLAYTISSTTPIASTTADISGYYEFSVMPGEYTVFEEMISGWEAVASSSLDVIILSGASSTENNFINHQVPYCGDGVVNQEIEQCDGSDGVGAHQSCTQECTLETAPYCGDHIINNSEQCDDGNTTGGDGCSASCTTEGGGGGTFIITNGGGGGGGGGTVPIVLGEEGAPILTIDKIVNVKLANPGDEIEYTVKVINSGNLVAYDVILNDTLPAGFTFSSDGSAARTINVGDLGAGDSREFKFKVKVSDGVVSGIYANIAQALASNHDPVSDYADVEVREIEILGAELSPTGFKMSEFIFLIAAILSLSGLAAGLRRRYRHSL